MRGVEVKALKFKQFYSTVQAKKHVLADCTKATNYIGEAKRINPSTISSF